MHPILQSRVGPDQFVSRILRLREDPRFRSVGPGVLEMAEDDQDGSLDELTEEDGLWFDFAFVEFLKTNYSQFLAPGAEGVWRARARFHHWLLWSKWLADFLA